MFNVFLIKAIVYLKKRIIREICISYNLCLLVGYWFDLLTSRMETTKVKGRQRSENLILPICINCLDGPLITRLWHRIMRVLLRAREQGGSYARPLFNHPSDRAALTGFFHTRKILPVSFGFEPTTSGLY